MRLSDAELSDISQVPRYDSFVSISGSHVARYYDLATSHDQLVINHAGTSTILALISNQILFDCNQAVIGYVYYISFVIFYRVNFIFSRVILLQYL